MTSCCDMKEGQIYECSSCGLRLQVLKACGECGEECCEVMCCDHPLTPAE